MTLTFGSLFSGIGGMDLGLERAGLNCVWQVEIDPYARRVLAKHWPHVPRWDDVRTFPPGDGIDWGCDLICGGFPCQDISNAGKRTGIDGERSGLWGEFARVVRVLRPRFVVVENVAAILDRGVGRVLGDLAACGYDAEWDCLPAAALGAPHLRDRLFVVAHAQCDYVEGATNQQPKGRVESGCRESTDLEPLPVLRELLVQLSRDARSRLFVPPGGGVDDRPLFGSERWQTDAGVCRVAHGVPRRMDRLRCLGNAVVPQVAEWIGRRILTLEATHET